jgi:hypothetical protein
VHLIRTCSQKTLTIHVIEDTIHYFLERGINCGVAHWLLIPRCNQKAIYGSRRLFVGQGTVIGCQVKNLAGDAIVIGITTKSSIISGNVVTSAPGGTGLIASGASLIMGNEVANCATGIWSNDGSLIGNTVTTSSSGQTGIAVPNSASFPTLMDQNTVTGPGTHYNQGSGAVQMRNNAGYP